MNWKNPKITKVCQCCGRQQVVPIYTTDCFSQKCSGKLDVCSNGSEDCLSNVYAVSREVLDKHGKEMSPQLRGILEFCIDDIENILDAPSDDPIQNGWVDSRGLP